MKRYFIANTVDEALALLAREGDRARIIAGGTDLLVAMRAGVLESGASGSGMSAASTIKVGTVAAAAVGDSCAPTVDMHQDSVGTWCFIDVSRIAELRQIRHEPAAAGGSASGTAAAGSSASGSAIGGLAVGGLAVGGPAAVGGLAAGGLAASGSASGGLAAGGRLAIGAAVTHARIAGDPLVAAASLILGMAAHSVGSPQIRNRGTIGGNVLTAAQCADTIPALLVLDAELRLRNSAGTERIVAIRDFFPKPKCTAIRSDELLMDIRFASLAGTNWKGSYYKLIRRAAVAKSRLNFATLASLAADGTIAEARISIGSTLPTPGRFTVAEQLLKGQRPSAALVDAAAEACTAYMIEVAGRRWSAEYKEPVVRNLARRQLALVLGLEATHDA
jgi:CO/xanthine dehydrogenase FAD-binding subunit